MHFKQADIETGQVPRQSSLPGERRERVQSSAVFGDLHLQLI